MHLLFRQITQNYHTFTCIVWFPQMFYLFFLPRFCLLKGDIFCHWPAPKWIVLFGEMFFWLRFPKKVAVIFPHSAVLDPEIKFKRLIFPTKHVIPESLKFRHWLSEFHYIQWPGHMMTAVITYVYHNTHTHRIHVWYMYHTWMVWNNNG